MLDTVQSKAYDAAAYMDCVLNPEIIYITKYSILLCKAVHSHVHIYSWLLYMQIV